MPVGILWTILIGFVVGVVAKAIMPGKDGGGFIATSLLGIGGAWVGTFLARMLGFPGRVGFIGAVIGAILLLMLFRWVRGRSAA
jgi:uncharacterized membrane protein YeaQ/YmgE (transglycosylase-associated protein family)